MFARSLPACDHAGDDQETCTVNLLLISDALEEYQRRHKSLPARLSDLRGQFLRERTRLSCPVARDKGRTSVDTTAKRSHPQSDPLTSYGYELGLIRQRTTRAVKTLEAWKKIAPGTPIVSCNQHGNFFLNLRVDDTVEPSKLDPDLPAARPGVGRRSVGRPDRPLHLADEPRVGSENPR